MTPLADVLTRIAGELGGLGAPYALVGGLAVSVRTEPRFTRDVDLAVAVGSDDEAEAIVRALRASGYRVLAHLEQTAAGRLASVRLEAEAGAPVDLLFASSGIEVDVVGAAEPLEVLPGVTVPVATMPHLLALKVLARDDRLRPQDRGDAVALIAAMSEADLDETRACLARISERGYQRARDLGADLDQLLGELA